jgi:hypothetical protein
MASISSKAASSTSAGERSATAFCTAASASMRPQPYVLFGTCVAVSPPQPSVVVFLTAVC